MTENKKEDIASLTFNEFQNIIKELNKKYPEWKKSEISFIHHRKGIPFRNVEGVPPNTYLGIVREALLYQIYDSQNIPYYGYKYEVKEIELKESQDEDQLINQYISNGYDVVYNIYKKQSIKIITVVLSDHDRTSRIKNSKEYGVLNQDLITSFRPSYIKKFLALVLGKKEEENEIITYNFKAVKRTDYFYTNQELKELEFYYKQKYQIIEEEKIKFPKYITKTYGLEYIEIIKAYLRKDCRIIFSQNTKEKTYTRIGISGYTDIEKLFHCYNEKSYTKDTAIFNPSFQTPERGREFIISFDDFIELSSRGGNYYDFWFDEWFTTEIVNIEQFEKVFESKVHNHIMGNFEPRSVNNPIIKAKVSRLKELLDNSLMLWLEKEYYLGKIIDDLSTEVGGYLPHLLIDKYHNPFIRAQIGKKRMFKLCSYSPYYSFLYDLNNLSDYLFSKLIVEDHLSLIEVKLPHIRGLTEYINESILQPINKTNQSLHPSLEAELAKTKSYIDVIKAKDESIYNQTTGEVDCFKKAKYDLGIKYNAQNMSNAWLKFYEMISRYNLIPSSLKKIGKKVIVSKDKRKKEKKEEVFSFSLPSIELVNFSEFEKTFEKKGVEIQFEDESSLFKTVEGKKKLSKKKAIHEEREYIVFDNASLPGSGILAIHHYIKTMTNLKYKWYASSLLPSNENLALEDQYELYKNYPENWLMSKKINGDVTDPKVLLAYKEKFWNSFSKEGTIDLYVSDLGFDVSQDFNQQENIHARANLGQVLQGLMVLRKGGNFLTKQYTFFSSFSTSLILLLSTLFEKFYISKPATSRPVNSEIYLIGKNFLGINEKLENYLLERLKEQNIYQLFSLDQLINQTNIQTLFQKYLNKFYKRQIRYIERLVYLTLLKINSLDTSNPSLEGESRISFRNEEQDLLNEKERTVEVWSNRYTLKILMNNDHLKAIEVLSKQKRSKQEEKKEFNYPLEELRQDIVSPVADFSIMGLSEKSEGFIEQIKWHLENNYRVIFTVNLKNNPIIKWFFIEYSKGSQFYRGEHFITLDRQFIGLNTVGKYLTDEYKVIVLTLKQISTSEINHDIVERRYQDEIKEIKKEFESNPIRKESIPFERLEWDLFIITVKTYLKLGLTVLFSKAKYNLNHNSIEYDESYSKLGIIDYDNNKRCFKVLHQINQNDKEFIFDPQIQIKDCIPYIEFMKYSMYTRKSFGEWFEFNYLVEVMHREVLDNMLEIKTARLIENKIVYPLEELKRDIGNSYITFREFELKESKGELIKAIKTELEKGRETVFSVMKASNYIDTVILTEIAEKGFRTFEGDIVEFNYISNPLIPSDYSSRCKVIKWIEHAMNDTYEKQIINNVKSTIDTLNTISPFTSSNEINYRQGSEFVITLKLYLKWGQLGILTKMTMEEPFMGNTVSIRDKNYSRIGIIGYNDIDNSFMIVHESNESSKFMFRRLLKLDGHLSYEFMSQLSMRSEESYDYYFNHFYQMKFVSPSFFNDELKMTISRPINVGRTKEELLGSIPIEKINLELQKGHLIELQRREEVMNLLPKNRYKERVHEIKDFNKENLKDIIKSYLIKFMDVVIKYSDETVILFDYNGISFFDIGNKMLFYDNIDYIYDQKELSVKAVERVNEPFSDSDNIRLIDIFDDTFWNLEKSKKEDYQYYMMPTYLVPFDNFPSYEIIPGITREELIGIGIVILFRFHLDLGKFLIIVKMKDGKDDLKYTKLGILGYNDEKQAFITVNEEKFSENSSMFGYEQQKDNIFSYYTLSRIAQKYSSNYNNYFQNNYNIVVLNHHDFEESMKIGVDKKPITIKVKSREESIVESTKYEAIEKFYRIPPIESSITLSTGKEIATKTVTVGYKDHLKISLDGIKAVTSYKDINDVYHEITQLLPRIGKYTQKPEFILDVFAHDGGDSLNFANALINDKAEPTFKLVYSKFKVKDYDIISKIKLETKNINYFIYKKWVWDSGTQLYGTKGEELNESYSSFNFYLDFESFVQTTKITKDEYNEHLLIDVKGGSTRDALLFSSTDYDRNISKSEDLLLKAFDWIFVKTQVDYNLAKRIFDCKNIEKIGFIAESREFCRTPIEHRDLNLIVCGGNEDGRFLNEWIDKYLNTKYKLKYLYNNSSIYDFIEAIDILRIELKKLKDNEKANFLKLQLHLNKKLIQLIKDIDYNKLIENIEDRQYISKLIYSLILKNQYIISNSNSSFNKIPSNEIEIVQEFKETDEYTYFKYKNVEIYHNLSLYAVKILLKLCRCIVIPKDGFSHLAETAMYYDTPVYILDSPHTRELFPYAGYLPSKESKFYTIQTQQVEDKSEEVKITLLEPLNYDIVFDDETNLNFLKSLHDSYDIIKHDLKEKVDDFYKYKIPVLRSFMVLANNPVSIIYTKHNIDIYKRDEMRYENKYFENDKLNYLRYLIMTSNGTLYHMLYSYLPSHNPQIVYYNLSIQDQIINYSMSYDEKEGELYISSNIEKPNLEVETVLVQELINRTLKHSTLVIVKVKMEINYLNIILPEVYLTRLLLNNFYFYFFCDMTKFDRYKPPPLLGESKWTSSLEIQREHMPTTPVFGTRGGIGIQKTNYAYVTLVMKGDDYIKGALVLAYSLKLSKVENDIICMVTSDVSEAGINTLKIVFDRIIYIDYIEHKSKPPTSKKNIYGWLDVSFTKWKVLTLTTYEKIVLLDADMIFKQNPDALFNYNTPCACFSNPWVKPYNPNGVENPYLDYYNKTYSQTEESIPSNILIPHDLARKSLYQNTFTIISAITILTPSYDLYEKLIKLINEKEIYGEEFNVLNGPDEVSIVDLTTSLGMDWYNLNQRWEAIPRKVAWTGHKNLEELEQDYDVISYHFIGGKPWSSSPLEWPDLKLWWDMERKMIEEIPKLESYFEIKEGEGREASELDYGYHEYKITRDLQNYLWGKCLPLQSFDCKKLKYEASNILERFLLGLSQQNKVGKFKVYQEIKTEDELIKRMLKELQEKNIPNPDSITQDVIRIIDERIKVRVFISNLSPSCSLDKISYSGFSLETYKLISNERYEILMKMGKCEDLLKMLMRYETVLSGSQQWGLTQKHFEELYNELNVRIEAYASPVNSRLLGKKNAKFGSLFLDTDKIYGSIGNIFKEGKKYLFESKENIQKNPPFIEKILLEDAQQTLELLNQSYKRREQRWIFSFGPAWKDAEFYKTLSTSKFKRFELELRPFRFNLEKPNGEIIIGRFACVYFALSSQYAEREEYGKMLRIFKSLILPSTNREEKGSRREVYEQVEEKSKYPVSSGRSHKSREEEEY